MIIGEFGEVYSGTYFESKKSKAGRKVAVKTLKVISLSETEVVMVMNW